MRGGPLTPNPKLHIAGHGFHWGQTRLTSFNCTDASFECDMATLGRQFAFDGADTRQ